MLAFKLLISSALTELMLKVSLDGHPHHKMAAEIHTTVSAFKTEWSIGQENRSSAIIQMVKAFYKILGGIKSHIKCV